MKAFGVPVVAIGPGSRLVEAEPLAVRPFAPMEPAEPPRFPDFGAGAAHAAALATVRALGDFARLASSERPPNGARVDVRHLGAADETLLNEALGEGEVSIVVTHPHPAKVQETAFAGVWRVRQHDDSGALIADYLEVAPIARVAREAAAQASRDGLGWGEPPAGVMNAESILKEIGARALAFAPGAEPQVINLSLVPVTRQDLAFIHETLGSGPVMMLSRGYGRCRITATRLRHVWLVQYFNPMDRLILDTVEIAEMPEVALAAPEDIADAARRLDELADWMAGESQ